MNISGTNYDIYIYIYIYICSVLPNHPSQMGKIMLRTGKKFCYHIGIVCVTCPNLLKMGVRTGAVKHLGRTLIWIFICGEYSSYYVSKDALMCSDAATMLTFSEKQNSTFPLFLWNVYIGYLSLSKVIWNNGIWNHEQLHDALMVDTHCFHQNIYFTHTGTILWLFQCQWSNPEEYG